MFKKIVYCSPIQWQLLLDGKPLSGIQVTRTLYSGGFSGNKNIDQATSDAQGRYQFPEVSERRLFRPDLLSSNPTVSIHFQANHKNTTYGLWFGYNPTYSLGAETNYPEIEIESELTDSEVGRYSVIVNSKVREIREEPPPCGSEDNPCN